MAHKLIIHMGMHKTGTTSLQYFLSDNKDLLNQNGYCYPDFLSNCGLKCVYNDDDQKKNGVVFFDENGNIDYEGERWKKSWEYIKSCLKKYDVIISAEDFFTEYVDEKLWSHILLENQVNNEIIIYLRRQDIWIEKWWAFLIKSGLRYSGNLEDFVEDTIATDRLYYHKYISKIESIMGKGNVVVKCYEKEQLVGENIVSDFLEYLHIQTTNEIESQLYKYRNNESLINESVEFMRLVNTARLDVDNDVRWRILENIFIQQKNSKYENSYMSLELRQKILDVYSEENKRIASEYLKRYDNKLFYDDYQPIFHHYSFNSNEEYLIKAMIPMIVYLEKRLEHVEICYEYSVKQRIKQVESLYYSLARGRRIILFGAGKNCNDFLSVYKIDVECIVDNDRTKAGTKYCGYTVFNTDIDLDSKKNFIIITSAAFEDIGEQLEKIGFKKNVDYITMLELMCG